MLATQLISIAKVDWAIKSLDSGKLAWSREKLVFFLIKTIQAIVVRAETTDLCAEEIWSVFIRHITSVPLPDKPTVGFSGPFREYFQGLFTREPGLRPAQFDIYLVEFRQLEAVKAAKCMEPVTEYDILEAVKLVDRYITTGLHSLPYELYSR